METLFTPKQVAERLCMSEMTLRKWRWEGKGPRFIKLGRKVVYRQDHLNDFVQSMVRTSTTDTGEVLQ
ncbi:MAG: DNA-binding protein [Verrucomicrobiae bacterium]|nr:DNA-binding protein [Verrucomicrobiae bacterium]